MPKYVIKSLSAVLLLAGLATAAHSEVQSQVFYCKDAAGRVTVSQFECTSGSRLSRTRTFVSPPLAPRAPLSDASQGVFPRAQPLPSTSEPPIKIADS